MDIRRLMGRHRGADAPAPFLHVVLTRYNIGAFNERWIDYRQELFESLTLPSLDAQTERRFLWALAIDGRTPAKQRERLEQLAADRPHLRLVDVELFHDFKDDMIRWARAEAEAEGASHILSTRLDNDDALRTDVFARIRHHAREVLDEGRKVPALITPTMGYQWVPASGLGFPAFHLCPSTGTSLLEPVEEFESVYLVPHHELPNAVNNLDGTIKAVDGDTRWWLHAATDASLSVLTLNNFRRDRTMSKKTSNKMDDDVLRSFGVSDGAHVRSLEEPAFVADHEEIIQNGKRIDEKIKVVRAEIKKRSEAGDPEDAELAARYEALHSERRDNAMSLLDP